MGVKSHLLSGCYRGLSWTFEYCTEIRKKLVVWALEILVIVWSMLQMLAKNGGVFGKVWLNNQWKAEGRHQIGKIYSERLERRLILKASKSKMISLLLSLLLAHILFNLFVSGDISPLASLEFTCDSLDFTCALLLFRGVGDVAVATLWCYQHASDTMLRGGQGR